MADRTGATETSTPSEAQPSVVAADPPASAATGTWERIKEHKILQWTLAYLGAALALAHGADLLEHAYHWPEIAQRLLLGVLIVALPLVLMLAWYHGHKGLKRVGAGELMIAAILLIIGAGLLIVLVREPRNEAPTETVASSKTSAAPNVATPVSALPGVSLAVLPFVDMSPEHNQEYFSDGLSEEVLNQLAQIKELRVTGRTSSFSFKGRNEDLRVIGEKLGVNHLLEGSVRKSDKRLRVTAQLINAADGTHLWSHSYDSELTDVFAVQEQIAMEVAQALSISLDVGEMSRAKGGTTNVDAYDKYLRARTLLHQLGPKEILQATQLYREALALDPHFVRAWDGMYEALAYSLTWIPENSVAELRQMAEASAHIIALAPDSWGTQSMRANQFIQQHKWSEAEAAARAALASAPTSETTVLISYGFSFLINVGRAREGLEYVRGAREIDPLSLGVSGLLQMSLDFAGRPAEAQAEYERSKDFAGDHAIWDWWAVQRLWSRKNATQAEVENQFSVLLKHESLPMALSQIVFKRLGNRDAALTAIREAFKDPSNQDGTRMEVVGEYADHFGDRDLALSAYRRALVELHSQDTPVLWQPSETGLRSDPRFKEILRDLGLVDYFRTSGKWGDFCKPLGKEDFECH
jgi:TolB-like protein/tetratricopeptide (TPR) repeat protein